MTSLLLPCYVCDGDLLLNAAKMAARAQWDQMAAFSLQRIIMLVIFFFLGGFFIKAICCFVGFQPQKKSIGLLLLLQDCGAAAAAASALTHSSAPLRSSTNKLRRTRRHIKLDISGLTRNMTRDGILGNS